MTGDGFMSSRLSRTAAISEAARSRTESVFLASFLFVVGMADAPICPATRARPRWALEHFSRFSDTQPNSRSRLRLQYLAVVAQLFPDRHTRSAHRWRGN